MKKSLLIVSAFASLIIVDATYGEVTPISWQDWNIAITDFQLTETVNMENMFEKNPVAEDGNIFVELTIKIKNNGKKGDSFRPSDLVKLSIHGASVDAADVLTDRLSDLIEPFTTQLRKFYFEIPKTFEGESAELQFGGEHFAVPITLSSKSASIPPAPTSTPVARATPRPTPEYDHNTYSVSASDKENSYRSTPSEDLTIAEDNLNRAWNNLTPIQRNRLRPAQRRWITYKDNLAPVERTEEVNKRADYLESLY